MHLMAKRQRKTLVICRRCHQDIHAGRATTPSRMITREQGARNPASPVREETALRRVRRFGEAITAHQDAAAIFSEAGDKLNDHIAAGNGRSGLALRASRAPLEASAAH
jgi:hypothetical protein